MLVYFAAHIVSSLLVLLTLNRQDSLPQGQIQLFTLSTVGVSSLALLAYTRWLHAEWTLIITLIMTLLVALLAFALRSMGKRHGWLPSRGALMNAMAGLRSRLPGATRGAHV